MNGTTEMSDAEGESRVGIKTASEINIQIIYIAIGTVGILGNLMVIIVIISNKSMYKKITNMFILDQSIVDLLASVFIIATIVADDIRVVPKGLAAEIFCLVWLTRLPLWALSVTSTYNLVFLTLDRYISIIFPFQHSTYITKTRAILLMALAWVIGFGFNIANKLPTSKILRSGHCVVQSIYPSADLKKTVGIFTIVLQYFIPLTVITYAYTHIACHLLRKTTTSGSTNQASGRDEKMQRARRNVIKTLAIVNGFFIICWSSNQIAFFLFNLGYPVVFNSTFYHFSVVMVNLNCCVNPFIYSLQYEAFQNGLKALFCCAKGDDDDATNLNLTADTAMSKSQQSMSEMEN